MVQKSEMITNTVFVENVVAFFIHAKLLLNDNSSNATALQKSQPKGEKQYHTGCQVLWLNTTLL